MSFFLLLHFLFERENVKKFLFENYEILMCMFWSNYTFFLKKSNHSENVYGASCLLGLKPEYVQCKIFIPVQFFGMLVLPSGVRRILVLACSEEHSLRQQTFSIFIFLTMLFYAVWNASIFMTRPPSCTTLSRRLQGRRPHSAPLQVLHFPFVSFSAMEL